MRKPILVLLLVLSTGVGATLNAQQSSGFEGNRRAHNYMNALVGPLALLGIGATTAYDQIRDDPPDWNFGNRLASNAGRLAVQETIHHGLAAIMNRSTWYYPCGCEDTGARAVHAFGEAFTDHDRAGGAHLSIARIAGAYGAAYAEAGWRPGRSGAEAFAGGTTSLIATGLLNLYREFAR